MSIRAIRAVRERWWGPLSRVLWTLAAVAVATTLAVRVFGRSDIANAVVVYLLVIGIISMRLGYRPAILAAISSVFCFDYFFLVPYGSFVISSGHSLVTFAAMFCVAVFISTLNERLRKQAQAARINERRTELLYDLVNELANTSSLDELCKTAATQIETAVAETATVLIRDAEGAFDRAFQSGGRVALETQDLALASWVASHLEAAGQGTRKSPDGPGCYVPLIAGRGCVGVVVLRTREGADGLAIRLSTLVLSMTRQIAMAVERTLLAEEKRAAQIEAETERIRNAVLSSVSHDLRTPLAVIASASGTLIEHEGRLSAAARAEMSRIINDEATHLGELLKSILDVTRLQAGALRVSREWESLEEVLGSVARRVDQKYGNYNLLTNVASDVPLIQIDAVLIEQVLISLVDNAIKYGASEQPIEINSVVQEMSCVLMSVIDHGRGIKREEMERIFDKFYRGGGETGKGLGLGLTIARGIVQAHHGRIWAGPTPGGGLTIHFTLPLTGVAPYMIEAEPLESGVTT